MMEGKMFEASLETQYLPKLAEQKVFQVLVENIDKYPDEKWKTQSVQEHLIHLVGHISDYQEGNRSEDMLAKVICRAAMAAWKAEQSENSWELADNDAVQGR